MERAQGKGEGCPRRLPNFKACNSEGGLQSMVAIPPSSESSGDHGNEMGRFMQNQ